MISFLARIRNNESQGGDFYVLCKFQSILNFTVFTHQSIQRYLIRSHTYSFSKVKTLKNVAAFSPLSFLLNSVLLTSSSIRQAVKHLIMLTIITILKLGLFIWDGLTVLFWASQIFLPILNGNFYIRFCILWINLTLMSYK